jgi:hypothetical protein
LSLQVPKAGKFFRQRAPLAGTSQLKLSVVKGTTAPNTDRQSADEFSDSEMDLIFALEKIERRQQQLNEANHELKVLVNDEPKLAVLWAKFESNGGTNTEQLRQFLKGEMRPRIITKRGGLRLISDRPQQAKIVHRRLCNDDDDDNGLNAA